MKKESNKNSKKKIIITLVLLLAVVTAGLSFAYFTDRAEFTTAISTGNLSIALDTTGVVTGDAEGKNIIVPGDSRVVSFDVSNLGNLSTDIKETLYITSSVPMTLTGQSEFEIYKASDVENVAGEGFKPKDGAEPLQVKNIAVDGLTATYSVPDYILNGKGATDADRQIEASALASDVAGDIVVTPDGTSVTKNYVFIFKGDAPNDFLSATANLKLTVEAKQHRGTEGVDWATIQTETFDFGGVSAVPKAN